jgi:hypothetical protein
MSQYVTVYTDAKTGQVTQVPWTQEQINARNARIANMGLNAPVVPASITRRQCALQLISLGVITPTEALNMVKTATVPAAIAAIFAGMQEDQRILAEIDFAADNYYRNNNLLGLMGLSSQEIDQFFIAAAQK